MKRIFGVNFLSDFSKIDEYSILENINNNTRLSSSYLALLISSIFVCTLGLLINSTPVVIGGMLIAPLMWPLLKISLGISFGEQKYIRDALKIFLISIFIALVSSIVIAFLSPIKQLNSEIIARTTPTLIDLVIALVSGAIAALAVTQTRISESLAGVAIAVALMPPLCVSGIGIAFWDFSIFFNSFLLFFVNVIAIIFAAIIVFMVVGLDEKDTAAIEEKERQLRNKGISLIAGIMIFTSLILLYLLQFYSFKNIAYKQVQSVLTNSLSEISTSIVIDNIKTEVSIEDKNIVNVEAKIWIPDDITFSLSERQSIISDLEEQIDAKVDLKLFLQKIISLETEEDQKLKKDKEEISEIFTTELSNISSSLSINLLEVNFDKEENIYNIHSIIFGDPSIKFTQDDLQNLESTISQATNNYIEISLEILPKLQLQTKPDVENEQIKSSAENLIQGISDQIEISSTNVIDSNTDDDTATKQPITIKVEILIPADLEISSDVLEYIKNQLTLEFEKEFELSISAITKNVYSL